MALFIRHCLRPLYLSSPKFALRKSSQVFQCSNIGGVAWPWVAGVRHLTSGLSPLNGPAISALCQGPQYFTFTDTSLSQIKGYHSSTIPRKTFLQRLKEGIGLKGKMRFKSQVMQKSGMRLYLCCVELIDYEDFFSVFQLPDTYNSWFRILELHIWMAMVRLKAESREGELIRNIMIRNMWEDVQKRTRKLGAASSSRAQGVSELNDQFRASLFAYDEGLLSDDKVLAGTVWRNFFGMDCDDPEKIENMVGYIRKQIHHIENQQTEHILGNGMLTFLPISGDKVHSSRTNQIVDEIYKRT